VSNDRHLIVSRLASKGVLTEEQVTRGEARAAKEHRPILKILIEDRALTEADIYRVVAEASNLPFVEIEAVQADPSATVRLQGEWAKRLHAMPFGWDGSTLLVAVDDPNSLTLQDDLGRLTQVDIRLLLAEPLALLTAINQAYRVEDEMVDLSETIVSDDMFSPLDETMLGGGGGLGSGEGDAPVVKYVNLLISQAVSDRASDVHVEPTETDVTVRFRIDGVMHKQMSSPKNILNGVVSRIKIMASMDISERRIPQDGRMSATVHGRKIDFRVSTLPTVHGEKVTLRVLDNTATPLGLRETGFSDRNSEIFKRQYTKPHGMILVTGPTGSGKSTTLYSTLNAVKDPSINIITVEDPVEFRIDGVSQMQINPKAGLTFSSALRSILRADPDIVLVGEIRDRETAQIGMEAALTGHLVLATLHTNDAPSAATRLIEMGVEPFLVGSAVTTIVAQRLLRKLCSRCKIPYELLADDVERLGIPWEGEGLPTLFRPAGCPQCSNLGYHGRTAIHEVLVVSDRLERMVNDGAHTEEIRRAAVAEGMEGMRVDGWYKVLAGQTSIEEVLRVVG
jgi:type IV pilus assembly protein PilB